LDLCSAFSVFSLSVLVSFHISFILFSSSSSLFLSLSLSLSFSLSEGEEEERKKEGDAS